MTDSINVYFTQYNAKVPDSNVNSIINESYVNKHANNALGQILCPRSNTMPLGQNFFIS